MNGLRIKISALLSVGLLLLTTSCRTPVATTPTTPTYSNQINQLDADTYTTLLASRAALIQFAPLLTTQYPQFRGVYDQAVTSYNTVEASYALFRTSPTASNSALISAEMTALTSAIINLESQFQVSTGTKAAADKLRNKQSLKAHAVINTSTNISLTTILQELQIAASVAAAIPGASPWAQLAVAIIGALQTATATIQAQAGQPIDLTQVAPLPVI